MYVQPHDLDHEFPEYVTLMHELKDHDERIARLCDEYESINHKIVDIEMNDKPFHDFEFEEMKKQRLRLKDEIYQVLIEHK